MAEKRRTGGLGRGLSALMDEAATSMPARTMLTLSEIVPSATQPRRRFNDAAMEELTASVRERGVLQPILVRPIPGRQYEIVAGERRWRAAAAAQLHEIPVVIRELDDAQAFEVALIENIQRADLNPMEEAEGFQRLLRDYGHTQDALAKVVGRSRSHVANMMRLLDLPEEVRALVADGSIDMGHARALISATNAYDIAQRVIAEGLSVRQVEALVRKPRPSRPSTPAAAKARDPNIEDIEQQVGEALGMAVSIIESDAPRGTMVISYSTFDQLDLLCRLLIVR